MGLFRNIKYPRRFGGAADVPPDPKLLTPVGTLAATGSTAADAAAITAVVTTVTATDDTVGVILPAGVLAGAQRIVVNTVAAKTLKVYPSSGGKINNLAANANIAVTASQAVLLIALGSDNWAAVYNA